MCLKHDNEQPLPDCVASAIYALFAFLPMGSHSLGIKRVVVVFDTASIFYSKSFDTLESSRCQNPNMLNYKVGENASLALIGYKTLYSLKNSSYFCLPLPVAITVLLFLSLSI